MLIVVCVCVCVGLYVYLINNIPLCRQLAIKPTIKHVLEKR